MNEFARSTSGRAALVALAIGLVGAVMAITLFPADAAVVDGDTSEGRITGDACEHLELSGESFTFDVPKGSANDQTRVFDETFGLAHGASVAISMPSNRSEMGFEMTNAWATAVVLFGRNNQGKSTIYDYSGESFLDRDVELASLSTGNIKRVTLCYEAFEYLFLCGVPITDADSPEGLNATFVRPEGTTGCNEAGEPDDDPKFGNIDFSSADDVIQFTPGGEGDAVFVGELAFDGGGPYSILQIDYTDNDEDNFTDMTWYVEPAPVFQYDLNDNLIGAEFDCGDSDWCILDGSIGPNGITWIIGGDDVDPLFR